MAFSLAFRCRSAADEVAETVGSVSPGASPPSSES
jgi:hypothetical protein